MRAELFVDGVLAYADTTSAGHYHFGGGHALFDTTRYAAGPHQLRTTVHDTAGMSGSAQIDVTIANGADAGPVQQPPPPATVRPRSGCGCGAGGGGELWAALGALALRRRRPT